MNEQDAFEYWLINNYPIIGLDVTEKEGERYIHKSTRTMWEAWQASANREGYKLVTIDEYNKIELFKSGFPK